MSGLLGKKVRMTQIFNDKGEVIPVTVIAAGPCYVTRVKTRATDGYDAIQLGYEEVSEKHSTRAEAGHCKKAQVKPVRFLREFEKFTDREVKTGDELKVDIFTVGEKIVITGHSKGRGFQGVVKRHHFGGGSITHGQSDRQRAPGSLGQSSWPSRVYKGLRMAGRMGNDRVTVPTTSVVRIDTERNLIFVKGAVPGAPNSVVEIKKV
jgi:large subunit ribosomal protein L3